jgi:hypothetical protein
MCEQKHVQIKVIILLIGVRDAAEAMNKDDACDCSSHLTSDFIRAQRSVCGFIEPTSGILGAIATCKGNGQGNGEK